MQEEKRKNLPPALALPYPEEELRQRAAIDALSGLLNRDTLETCIKRRLDRMHPGESCALFIVDLDNFKRVNDTLGHQAGDQAIRETARQLSRLFRASDIVGRLGGDEFAIFLCGRLTEQVLRDKGAAICRALQFSMGDRPAVSLTASVGIYFSQGIPPHLEGLYQSADLALYKAKKAGKNGFCLKYSEGEAAGEDFRPVNTIPIGGLLEYLESGVALVEMGEPVRVIYVSPSWCRLVGADPKNCPVPRPLSEIIHPDDLPALEEILRWGLREGRQVEHIHRVAVNGGSGWAWWQVRAAKVEYDNPNPVLLVTATDVTPFKQQEDRLLAANQLLQAAMDQTSQRVWKVDLASGAFRLFGAGGRPLIGTGEGVPFPDYLLEQGWVHPDSAPRFRVFAQELLAGQSQGYGNFIFQYRSSGCYQWMAVSYRMLTDEMGCAVRAVGVVEDLALSLAGRDGGMALYQPLPGEMASDLAARMRANLDRDVVEELWAEGQNLRDHAHRTSCSQLLLRAREQFFRQEDREKAGALLDRERLLRLFQEGERWLCAEFRRVDAGGNISWVRQVLHLAEDPVTHEALLFGYLVRLPQHDRWEQAAGGSGRDGATGFYDRQAILRAGHTLLAAGGTGAAVLFQVLGLSSVNSLEGGAQEQLFRGAAMALAAALGGGCALGRYGDDQLLLLFSTVPSQRDLRQRLEEAMAFVRRSLAEEAPAGLLRLVAGAAVQQPGMDFAQLLDQAVKACGQCWNAALDMVAFPQAGEDWGWAQLQSTEGADRVAVHGEELERPLSEGEKEVALRCVSAMLAADSLESSIRAVLADIGGYYQADRVYILTLTEDGQGVAMLFEWTGPGKRSIQQAVSGMRLERVPLLERCRTERAPVFLTRQDREGNAWHFTTCPLIRRGQVEGFLCIENAREHPADAALFSTLIPCLLRERDRFRVRSQTAEAADQLMGLPDLRSYMETAYMLDSDRYSSLGAVCLEIPDMARINGAQGFAYGSRLLWYASKTLTGLFGPSLVFRTGEAEFVAFCPNTTRQVFLGRCGRLRSILQRRYPKQVRLGQAWSDGVFNGKRLTEEARLLMGAGAAPAPAAVRASAPPEGKPSPLAQAVKAGRLTVHFQPQVDMRTGQLIGAEALVRGMGEQGELIPPGKFIGLLEQDGSIRELDLYVLDRTLAQLDAWRQAGKPLRAAVNLSRVTVLHPSLLASVLAIQSRYPQLPAGSLELELTESTGGGGTGQLGRVVEQLRGCGLRLALDDFGSQYANLSLFANVRFDTVKLDRSLITGLVDNPISRALVRDLVQICHTYGMRCVAEGVETREQSEALLQMGCVYAQGYLYDRPLPPEQFWQRYLQDPPEREA